ncbi:hypothetical protein HPB47_014460 [Ixodes persulcatus]|uniref:Uncharacterized protein n=1 Tax=Ixodes persulcatus TaxID=34615 RepID=A0AC60QX41_IXOPE|nr:hypothetical protein HPB47_014460 [Ixodes persulcatus]
MGEDWEIPSTIEFSHPPRPSGGLQPLFGRTVRHQNSVLVKCVTLWRSLPKTLTDCPPQEKEDLKAWCKEASDFLQQ